LPPSKQSVDNFFELLIKREPSSHQVKSRPRAHSATKPPPLQHERKQRSVERGAAFTETSCELVPQDCRQVLKSEFGISELTSIQRGLLQYWPSGHNLLVKAPTGTGKTLGYLLATILDLQQCPHGNHSLIIVPTMTLRDQIAGWWQRLSLHMELPLLVSSFASHSASPPLIQSGVRVHSGRCDDLVADLANGRLDPRTLRSIIVDECDAMLKPLKRYATHKQHQCRVRHRNGCLTFLGELVKLQPTVRLVFLSATLNQLTRRDLLKANVIRDRGAILIEADTHKAVHLADSSPRLPPQVRHLYRALPDDADVILGIQEALAHYQGSSGNSHVSALVIVPDDTPKSDFVEDLKAVMAGYKVDLLDQPNMGAMENCLLIASRTDTRGLDIPHLDLVIIVGCPDTANAYVHMSGRVGRAMRAGSCYTLLSSFSNARGARSNDVIKFLAQCQHLGLRGRMCIF
jgi:superfamily II DNA/RNA helicase